MCRKNVEEQGLFCATCFKELRYITVPHCSVCCHPLELSVKESVPCGRCLKDPPSYDQARAFLIYNSASKKLVLRFKNYGATYLVPFFVQKMVQQNQEALEKADLIMPVPLHWRRLIWRGYNQAALLARAMAKKVGKPCLMDVLQKKKHTPSQGKLSLKMRDQNVKGAFFVSSFKKNKIKDKYIILVDDVLSSGATLQACAALLKKKGAKRVDVAVIARAQLKEDL